MFSETKRFVFLNPPGVFEGILISLLIIIVFYGSVKSTRLLSSPKKRITLVSLHLISLIMLFFILLNPAVRTENYEEEKPKLAILVDNSWSMNLPSDEEGNSRIEAVRDFFNQHDHFFSKVEENFLVSHYVFDQLLKPVSSDFIKTNEPNGVNTDIANLLVELKDKHESGELDSVILFSDGADTRSKAGNVAEFWKNLGFPVYTVSSSPDDITGDVWIDRVKVSPVAFVRYPVSVEIVVKSKGINTESIPITLKEGDKLVSIREVFLDPASAEGNISFVIQPTSVGRKIYTVSIPVISGDSIKENNQKSFVLDVIVNKIRVLHIAGSPSWDVKFLRRVLERNPNIDLVSFFILREATDLVFAAQNELSLIPFPVDEIFGDELETFDVVIFHNFDFRPYGIYGYHLDRLKNYVTEEGGAFLMIGGDRSFNSGGYGITPLSDVLPVELDYLPAITEDPVSEKEFYTTLTSVGTKHPITKLIPDQKENQDNWKEMPALDGINRVQGLKPSALPILATPEGDPILVISKAESGKVASFLSDSSWKWIFVRGGEGEIAPYYEKFWNRLLLWLINDPELKEVRIKTDKPSYNLGENPRVDIQVFNREIDEHKMKSVVTFPNFNQIELKVEKKSPDGFRSEIQAEEYGVYRVDVNYAEETGLKSESNQDETLFLVEPPENEVRGPTTDANLLKEIAEKTGGRFITIRDSPRQLQIDFSPKKSITGYKTVRIWDNPWFFVLLVAIFSSEWILRRRWGLR
jgi:uncharacterized membrane protein